jgi:putative endonuclease
LDIIAREDDSLVIVEVRARSSGRFGSAAESVDWRKRARLMELARRYVQMTKWQGPWRIDVVTLDLDRDSEPKLVHIRNAVTG